ncbi:TerB family tellurite resistance protein [Flavobacteriaceae bacterium]|nr:TerB family tellurite resistance protein [Flavobacteriaceae bacterium]MDA9587796.1 TerB family tellurite resistance protein [Flavobacteriaceae bacterium]MDA9852285.1 TerB family tellurite resistance protein [Flavobacteriaceae bacterium]MDC0385853.1 TerB family tellurite resistance protein [Flavobacteriaceae bacterium]
MSYSDLYTPGFKSRNRDHFAAIVRIALADGIISEEEQAFLNRTAINLEIEADEVTEIMKHIDKHPINPPSTKERRLERLYDLTRMVFADHIADEAEQDLMKRLLIGLGFPTDQVESTIDKAFTLIKNGSDQDDFVAAFN